MPLNRANFELTSYLEEDRASFTWQITDFSFCSEEVGFRIRSETFFCCAAMWSLEVLPNGGDVMDRGKIGIFLHNVTLDEEKKVKFKAGIKGKNGAEYFTKKDEFTYEKKGTSHGFSAMFERKLLLENKDLLFNNILTVYSEIVIVGSPIHGEIHRKSPDDKSNRSIICPHMLSENFGTLYEDEKLRHDATLKTPDEEFPVHKVVLAAHSPVFAAMFEHNMKEKRSRVVEIGDVETSVLNDFIRFLYTGRVEDVTTKKAIGLFQVADKYAVEELKSSCVDFLCSSISLDSFFDIANLASTFNERSLMASVKTFFVRNLDEVILTNEWDVFVRERPDAATEIKKSYHFEF